MSAVSAGVSEVLIKYTGKYVKIYFIMKITYPIIRLPEHLHSTILLHAKITSNNHTTNGNEFPSPINARSPVS